MKASEAKKIDDLFELREVGGKRVFVVDDHHKAFAAWAIVRRERGDAPTLISFDHHTDTMPAYGNISARTHPNDDDERETLLKRMQAKLGWTTDDEVLVSVAQLRHDEHIDAAAICGILRASFSIQLSDMGGWPIAKEIDEKIDELGDMGEHSEATLTKPKDGRTFEPPEHNMFVIAHECFVGCKARPHTDACVSAHYSQILETVYVEDQLARAFEMARCIGIPDGLESTPYILDIDLDVFHTVGAIEPKDTESFYRLIRGALAITIATEAGCVADLWWPHEKVKLSASELLDRTLQHIERALGAEDIDHQLIAGDFENVAEPPVS